MQALLIQLLLIGGPLLLLANYARVYPHGALIALASAAAVASTVLLWDPSLLIPVLGADAVIAVVALFDLASIPWRGDFEIERQMGRIASLNKKHPVTLLVTNRSEWSRFVEVRDGADEELNPKPATLSARLKPRSRALLHYEIQSVRRGAFELRVVFLRTPSLLRFWWRRLEYNVCSDLHIYPDMKQLSEYALLARTNRLNLLGVRRTRRIGQDNEFERLRDYTLDDNFKHIEWRTTARRNKLTVKDFQNNQSQTVIFLIDCGRMMVNEAAGLSLLDHALNSMLMLSYVALNRGDSVGLICFSDGVHGFVPPKGGLGQMNRLLHASFDRFPSLVESRYDEAFLYLNAHCRKRSLVIFMSNVIDEVNAHQVHEYLGSAVGRHLPLGVLLRDRRLFEAVETPHARGAALFRAAAAADILVWRRQVLADLASRGVLSVDVFPEDMTAPLINRYLEIKARNLL